MFEDETELILRARKGDQGGFAALYNRYQPAVYRYILYHIGDTAGAEMLTAEVFARLVEEVDRLDQRGPPLLAHLYTIAHDLISESSWGMPAQPMPSSKQEAVGEEVGPSETRVSSVTQEGLIAAIASLPEEQRRFVLLRFIEGMDTDAVARALGKSLREIEMLQSQALSGLTVGLRWWVATHGPGQYQGEDLERIQRELIQNLTHELRTPLSFIQGYSELLIAGDLGPLSEAQRAALEIIHDRALVLSRVIRNLTALMVPPHESIAFAPVSMQEVVMEALGHYRPLTQEAGIQIEVELPDDLPPIIGDRQYLLLALSQLVDNAIKFSPDGGRVQIRGWMEGEWFYLSIQDQGTGIAAEHLDRIFDRFYQADGSTTRRFSGVGLGLTIVRATAEAHGGRVWATSEGVDKGSIFTLALPIRPAGHPASLWEPSRTRRWQRELSSALDECLRLMEEGEAAPEECLARYPAYAEDFSPLLKVILEIRRAPRLASSPAAFAAGERRMRSALAEKRRREIASMHPLRRFVEWIAAALLPAGRPARQRLIPALQMALAIVFALALIGVGSLSLVSQVEEIVPRTAALEGVFGVVEVLPTGSDSWRLASVGEELEAGDRIRTGHSSVAILAFFDGSRMALEADTKVTIVQVSSQRDGGGRVIVLHQWLGQTYTEVQPLPDRASRFEVETPTAVTLARGTEFVVEVYEDGTTEVFVFEGVVDVTAQEETLSIYSGHSAVVYPAQAPAPARVVSAPPEPAWNRLLFQPLPLETPRPTRTPTATAKWRVIYTPTPTETSTPRPEPTRPRPVPSMAPLPTETPTSIPPTPPPSRPTPTAVPTSTPTPTPTPSATPTPTLTPTATITPTATPTTTVTITPTNTPTLEWTVVPGD